MGFNYHNLGLIRECWIDNGILKFKQPMTGEEVACQTDLDVSVPKQTNIFYSKTVAFLLYADDKCYIGRYDGKVSVYMSRDIKTSLRNNGPLLIGLKNWKIPPHPHTATCGYYCTGGMAYEIYLNMDDGQSLYCGYHFMEAKLAKRNYGEIFDLTYAVAMTEKQCQDIPWYIYTEGGIQCETECRSVQDSLWKRNCPVFL